MNENRKKELVPEQFKNDEEAGKFWDTHSASDYWDYMEEEEMEFDIQSRMFMIPIPEAVYLLAKKRAGKKHSSAVKVINALLERELVAN